MPDFEPGPLISSLKFRSYILIVPVSHCSVRDAYLYLDLAPAGGFECAERVEKTFRISCDVYHHCCNVKNYSNNVQY